LNTLLIAGTDTDAGKTILTTALAAYWLHYYPQHPLGLMKLIQTGVGDREQYQALFDLKQSETELNPLHYQAPLAPPIAAAREKQKVDLGVIWKTLEQLRSRCEFVLAEGIGGLGTPVTNESTVADLAWDWRLPTVLVVPVRLGALGQVVANVALAKQSRVHLKGIVLNCPHEDVEQALADWAPPKLIQTLTQTPVLGIMPRLGDPSDRAALIQVAAALDLERLLPLPT
jgi:dethiobiotin synthetase